MSLVYVDPADAIQINTEEQYDRYNDNGGGQYWYQYEDGDWHDYFVGLQAYSESAKIAG